jgi:hypothetical protein
MLQRTLFTPIEIKTEEYGSLQLRPDLTVGDIEYLSKLEGQVTPREFTIEVVHRILRSPVLGIDEIRGWEDSLLQTVAFDWAGRRQWPVWELSEELPPFSAFQSGFQTYIDSLTQRVQESLTKAFAPVTQQMRTSIEQVVGVLTGAFQNLQLTLASALQPIQTSLAQFAVSYQLTIPVSGIFEALPDPWEISNRLAELERTATALDDSGYGFMLSYWMWSDVARFSNIGHVDARVRHAATTNRLFSLTCSDEFRRELLENFRDSSILKRRQDVVDSALVAHCERRYMLSIPVLLAQLEGMFTDALIVKGTVVRKDKKLYAKDKLGNLKLNRKGKPIELRGLGEAIQHADIGDEEDLYTLAKFITDYLIPERNAIMHGRAVSYDRAKLSVQLLLTIYVLSLEFAWLEPESESR